MKTIHFIILILSITLLSCNQTVSTESAMDSMPSDFANSKGIDGSALDTNIDDGKQQGKIYVCKYTRTPGGMEVLKKGNKGLVHVSPNSVRNVAPDFPTVNIGDFWTDAHTLSVIIDPQEGYDVLNGSKSSVEVCNSYSACELTENTGIIYGMKRNSGEIYEVDVINNIATKVFTSLADISSNISPNGLAYDSNNDRLYYTNYRKGDEPRNLYYYSFEDNSEYIAGEIDLEVAAGSFYNGKYYAMDSGQPSVAFSDNMTIVKFKPNGTIKNKEIISLSDGLHDWAFEGDIAINSGVLYGWGYCLEHKKYEFFTYDLNSSDFTITIPDYQESLQLAFGSNGVLYGHRSGGQGNFYEIDTSTGETGDPIIGNELLYTDTASGLKCIR